MRQNFIERQQQINFTKFYFSKVLETQLGLMEIQAPLLSRKGDGIQDDLSGVEVPVSVKIKSIPESEYQVVHSLAKWKRKILGEYHFHPGEGIYTHMKALRPDESHLSSIHSVMVDQWDWEQVIRPEDRNLSYLKEMVMKIYTGLKNTEAAVASAFGLKSFLPPKIHFIHSEELLQKFPGLNAKQRERAIAQQYGAVFIIGIGHHLSDGQPHDLRAPDYDDWFSLNEDGYCGLNGDIIVWNPAIEDSFEISSMGIRVNAESLKQQMQICRQQHKLDQSWHRALLANQFPQTIGGGIGQSRLVMLLLQKQHIGQVQCGVWPKEFEELALL